MQDDYGIIIAALIGFIFIVGTTSILISLIFDPEPELNISNPKKANPSIEPEPEPEDDYEIIFTDTEPSIDDIYDLDVSNSDFDFLK